LQREALRAGLARAGHIASEGALQALALAIQLRRALLLEGPSGAGKTHLAECLARFLGAQLVKLAVYPEMEAEDGAYGWNYARQLLSLRLHREHDLHSADHLVERPLLRALRASQSEMDCVLLVEGLEAASSSLEAVLDEVLEHHALTVEKLGRVQSCFAPLTIITTHNARQVSDRIRRRCIHHHCDYPDAPRERRILHTALPNAARDLSAAITAFVASLRVSDLAHRPDAEQLLEWTRTLRQLDAISLDPLAIQSTLGVLLKHQDTLRRNPASEAGLWLERLQQSLETSRVT
jgi:MoxR-like ATPase